MDTDVHGLPLHEMLFDLGHVVGDVINLVNVIVAYFSRQSLFEAPPNVMSQHLAVGERVIGRRFHGRQVFLPVPAAQGGANQLSIW